MGSSPLPPAGPGPPVQPHTKPFQQVGSSLSEALPERRLLRTGGHPCIHLVIAFCHYTLSLCSICVAHSRLLFIAPPPHQFCASLCQNVVNFQVPGQQLGVNLFVTMAVPLISVFPLIWFRVMDTLNKNVSTNLTN